MDASHFIPTLFSDTPNFGVAIQRGIRLEADCAMVPVTPVVISAAFSAMDGIANAVVCNQFMHSPMPTVFVDLVRLGAS